MTPRPNQATVSAPAETIAAIATAQGRGGVGIIRISGRDLLDFAHQLSGKRPNARMATLASFHAADGSVIDSGLLLHFPAPNSFTGEDVLELQGHGGMGRPADAACAPPLTWRAKPAEPGEFTRRAFQRQPDQKLRQKLSSI